jgi:rhamnogalacturonan endolyase
MSGGSAGVGGCTVSADSESDPGDPNIVRTSMGTCSGHYRMENLNRGVVAIQVNSAVYVGWRMSGCEYDPDDPGSVSYDVYRDGTLIANVTGSTNYWDTNGQGSSTYTVRAVVDGVAQSESEVAPTWAQNFLTIPLNVPAGGTVDRVAAGQTDAAYMYTPNDASTGDLDGDGELDIVLKWDPSNSKDNSQTGFTGNVLIDAYRLDGTQLWRIDLGRNIRAGAHYTQFLVYDFDGDGRSDVAMKTAPGTRDGLGQYLHNGPAKCDDDALDGRNSAGFVLSGPEYLTVFSGLTGAELSTAHFVVDRSLVYDWGDSTGNRADRFLASAAFVSDLGLGQTASGSASILMARGYYTRATMSAWNWRNGKLSRIWLADSYPSTSTLQSAYGQGAHTMAVADVDQDGAQEVMYGAASIDSNGAFLCSTGFGHGDALHVTDLVPSRSGLEVFMPHESTTGPSYSLRDGNDCTVLLQGAVTGKDTARGVAGDINAANPGAELWANGSTLVSATTGSGVGSIPSSSNFLIWWDGDETRELLNDVVITKYGAGTLLTGNNVASNNSTKATPVLTADLLGDWREEVIWRTSDNTALKLYTTTHLTTRRIYTLMHDPQYRMQVSSEQTGYNQPPHPSFHIGDGMAPPPKPNISVQ